MAEPAHNICSVEPTALDPIDLICCSSERERMLRRRLHRARDMAGRQAWQLDQSPQTRCLYGLAEEVAGDWIFAPADPNDLDEIIRSIAAIFRAASTLNRLERRDD